jgi:sugar lactone lactonase YvrE
VKAWSATPGLLSEGPRWHEERQELLWVEILGCQMHRGTLSADVRMNAGACDPQGRFWAGTMGVPDDGPGSGLH